MGGSQANRKSKKKEQARRKRDLKRKLQQAEHKGGDAPAAAEQPPTKAADNVEQPSKKTKKLRKPEEGLGEDHPSWKASKNAKISGSLVEGTGKRTAFQSDSDSES